MGSAGSGSGSQSQDTTLKGKILKLQSANSTLSDSNDRLRSENKTLTSAASDVAAQKAAQDAQQSVPDATVAKIKADTIPGNGTYMIGADIQPGTYRSVDNSGCYWSRLSGLSGSMGDILANDNVNGQAVVTIAATDKAFTSSRRTDWQKIG